MYIIDTKDGSIQKIPKNRLSKWDIISIQKDGEDIYRAAIILSKQVLFWGNFCALLSQDFSSLPSRDEVQREISSWNYSFYFIDFYEALGVKRVYEIGKKFPTESIFGGKIKLKEYLEDFDETTGEIFYSEHNIKERLSEKELEDFVLQKNGMISPILLDVLRPQEVLDTEEIFGQDTLELLAYQQDIVEQNWYFYSIKDIEKLDFSPLAMVKPDAQTLEEQNIPEVFIVVEKIDSIL